MNGTAGSAEASVGGLVLQEGHESADVPCGRGDPDGGADRTERSAGQEAPAVLDARSFAEREDTVHLEGR